MARGAQRGSRSGIINTKNSMLIVDEQAFPINLGNTVSEDTPEGSFRLLAYNGKNVLPTALGYRAYFSDSAVFGLEELPSSHCQAIIAYQTANLSTVLVALCEEGAYVANATEGEASTWSLQVNSGYDPVDLVRHQWSYAVVANKLCIYQQGMPAYYVFSDRATSSNLVSQAALFPTATVVKEYDSIPEGYSITSIIPTFINMAGQIGLFRADNRLGFWDSDNAVAWSSATQLFDMTPSTETFAGITTFADVQGQIVKILAHGEGFVIYATRSIVLAQGLNGSPERFAGRAIMTETGVVFDTQCCYAQPDTLHFAITSAGLVKITNGVPEFIHTEVSDYVQEHSEVVSIAMVDGRYLFLYTTDDLQPSKIEFESVKVVDSTDTEFKFLPPVVAEAEPYYWLDFDVNTDWELYKSESGGQHNSNAFWELNTDWATSGTTSLRTKTTYGTPGLGLAWRLSLYGILLPVPAGTEVTISAKARLVLGSLNGSPFVERLTPAGLILESLTATGTYLYDIEFTFTYQGVGSSTPNGYPASTLIHVYHGLIGSATTRLYIDDIKVSPAGGGAGSVKDTISNAANGSDSAVQAGFANFQPVNAGVATIADDKLLVPCYSGGKFSSDWMYSGFNMELADLSIRNVYLTILNLPGMISSVAMKSVRFDTTRTTTSEGPLYKDPLGIDRERFIDKAGQEYVDLWVEAMERMNEHLSNQALTTENWRIEAPEWEDRAIVGSPIKPYPKTFAQSLGTDIDPAWEDIGYELVVEDYIDPASVEFIANECNLSVRANTVEATFDSKFIATVEVVKPVWFTSTLAPNARHSYGTAVPFRDAKGEYQLVIGYFYFKASLEELAALAAASVAAGYGGSGWATLPVGPGTPAWPDDTAVSLNYLIRNRQDLIKVVYDPRSTVQPTIGALAAALVEAEGKKVYTPVLNWGTGQYEAQLVTVDKDTWSPVECYALQQFNANVVEITNTLTLAGMLSIYEDGEVTQSVPGSSLPVLDDWFNPMFTLEPDPGVLFGFATINIYGDQQVHEGHFYQVRFGAIYYSGDVGVVVRGQSTVSSPWPNASVPNHITYTSGTLLKPGGDTNASRTLATNNYVSWRTEVTDGVVWPDIYDYYRQFFTLESSDLALRCKWQIDTEQGVTATGQKMLFASEISGYGYIPGGGFSFRKTHTRTSTTSCPLPGQGSYINPGAILDSPPVFGGYPNQPGGSVKPGTPWPYPAPVPISDSFALFRKGSFGPFYPTYEAAVFLDTLYEKWGRYNHPHKVLLSLLAANRADGGVVPTKDLGLRGGSLRPDGFITNWAGDGKTGEILYGRIGRYRLGTTSATKVILRFAEAAECSVVMEPSFDGVEVDRQYSTGTVVSGAVQIEIPFTLAVKWFNIRLEGQFNLVGISFESEARGRR